MFGDFDNIFFMKTHRMSLCGRKKMSSMGFFYKLLMQILTSVLHYVKLRANNFVFR